MIWNRIIIHEVLIWILLTGTGEKKDYLESLSLTSWIIMIVTLSIGCNCNLSFGLFSPSPHAYYSIQIYLHIDTTQFLKASSFYPFFNILSYSNISMLRLYPNIYCMQLCKFTYPIPILFSTYIPLLFCGLYRISETRCNAVCNVYWL